MISAVFSSVKPSAAAAQPEYELSIDTTTGMSAPPIGMISRKPMTKESAVMIRKASIVWLAGSMHSHTTPPIMAAASRMLIR